MDLSIVIPVFNEETKIAQDLQNTSIFLQQNNINAEIIIVDDGSNDSTFEIATQVANKLSTDIKVLKLEQKR